MYFTGIIIAVCTFLTIGIWHPIVIKTEYHWGTRPWIVYLLIGLACIIAALFIENTILSWLKNDYRPHSTPLMEALLKGDVAAAQKAINLHLEETISCRDFIEYYYHGFLTGLLAAAKGHYRTLSNFESGDGYPDIQVGAMDNSICAILEVKQTSDESRIESLLAEAEHQFRTRRYERARLRYDSIIGYAVVFCRKRCTLRRIQ